MAELTRRGFLSLCAALPIIAKMPATAQPLIEEAKVIPIVPRAGFQVMRYSLGLVPDLRIPIEPGRIGILRAIVPRVMRPDRLMLSHPGFNLLHLGMNGEPLLDEEIPSEFFTPNSYGGAAIPMATLQEGEQVIIAAVNRNAVPTVFYGSLMGTALHELTPEQEQVAKERLARNFPLRDDDDDDEDFEDDDS